LRQLRTGAGLTQEELAAAARVSARTISDLERGISATPRTSTARLLADALGLGGSRRRMFEAAARGQPAADAAAVNDAEPHSGLNRMPARMLPRDVAAFTGRAAELEWLAARVTEPGSRGVVLICAIGGMAGIGKTALSVHAAHQLAARFPGGQFFVPLHGHTPGHQPADPADVLADLLLAAGVPAREIPPGLEPLAARWRDFLAGQKVLLVLDDATGHDQVRPLLPATAGSLVLISSRRRLSALEDAAVIDLDAMPPADAAELLARLADRPGLDRADPAVGQITRLCGYLPLAIAMMAGQFRHHPAWTPADRAAELAAARDRLEMMQAEDVSVGAAFSLSYRDLTEGQRCLFRRFGLHPGADIDAHSAAAVGGLDLATARRELEVIYDQHLLTEPNRGRYKLHDLVREHARGLAAADDPLVREAAVSRLMDYYLQTALAAGQLIGTWIFHSRDALPAASLPAYAPKLTTADEATRWMRAEAANLRAVAEHAAASGRAQHATLIPAAMAEYLHVHGRWQDGIPLHQTAVAAARAAGDKVGELGALTALAQVQFTTGDYVNARASLDRKLALDRELGDRAEEAYTLRELALVYSQTCDYPRAFASCRAALAIFRDLGSDRGIAASLLGLGHLHHATQDYPAAAASYQQALPLYRVLGDLLPQALALINLSEIAVMTGDGARATAHLEQARAILHDIEDQYLQGGLLHATGMVQRLLGNYGAAQASFRAAVEHSSALSLAGEEAASLNELGLTLQLTGDYAAAETAHQRALTIFRRWSDRLGQADVLNSLGELSLRLAATGKGREHHAQALELARDIGAQREEARALEGTGRCHLHNRNTAAGTTFLRQALDIYQRLHTADVSGIQQRLGELALAETPKPS
jgi:tetratricopeptide (TPR) repeat protein/transcriptional regulator with XRE-family HTH domain